MPFARTSFLRSFRFRVMFAMVVVVVGTMLITNILVRAILQPKIYLQFQSQLVDEADEVIDEIRVSFPEGISSESKSKPNFRKLFDNLERRARSRGEMRWFIRLYDAKTHVLYESDPEDPDMKEVLLPTNADLEHMREGELDGKRGKYCWIDKFYPPSGSPPSFCVQIGRSRAGLIEDIDLLDQTLFVRGIFVVLLAPLGGYYLARQVLRPIANIILTAGRLQPQNLTERLPVRSSNDELDKVSLTINGMLDRIATYIDKNRAFVANAAHELRSPLAAMRTSAEVALNRSRSPEEYATVLTEMYEEVGRLTKMVNRLLLLAESDAGGLIPTANQKGRLDKVIRESFDMFHAVAESVGVQLQAADLPEAEVPGDDVNLRHVVRNLIDNAIKFSREGGVVTVSLRLDQQRRLAIMTVADQGIGVPANDLPRLFERFFRGDRSRYRDDGAAGSGLGLSICHAIVTDLGGKIHVDSEVGKGTTFTVEFPLANRE